MASKGTRSAKAEATHSATHLTKAKVKLTPEEREAKNVSDRLRRVTKRGAARIAMQAANVDSMAVKFLTIEQLEVHLNRSRASIYRDVLRGTLPPALKITPRCSRWDSHAIDAAMAALATGCGCE